MIKVLIPYDAEFWRRKDECKKLYESVQDKITDENSFEFIIRNTFFYLFLNDDKLIGAIYYFIDTDGKLFLNGFAKRKWHLINLKCLKMSTEWFKEDIYAQAQNRASALCLLKCGFKRVEKNIFKKEKNNVKKHFLFI